MSTLRLHRDKTPPYFKIFDYVSRDCDPLIGAGEYFFRAVSHQLYGDPYHHLQIRQAGIIYLRTNPEHFIESNTHSSWNDYLANMSLQGS